MKYLLISLLFLSGCCSQYYCEVHPEDITNMYSSYIEEWQTQCKISFDNAEKKVFNINPAPQPSPIVGPNPDVAKCICGGTGIIVQGDGHKTPCPYHAKTTNLKR